MSDLVNVLAKAGILPMTVGAEFRRWGMAAFDDLPMPEEMTVSKVITQLMQAMEDEGVVLVKETDLAALDRYLKTQRLGTLNLFKQQSIPIMYGVSLTGEILIPWTDGDSIEELLTDPDTFLEAGSDRLSFVSCRPVFYGEQRAFYVCTVAKEGDANV